MRFGTAHSDSDKQQNVYRAIVAHIASSSQGCQYVMSAPQQFDSQQILKGGWCYKAGEL
jgi:hypothetical protein